MNTKFLAIFACAVFALPARACDERFNPACGNPLISSVMGTAMVIYFPTFIVGVSIATATNKAPNKEVVVRAAAVEAAEYIQNGQMGPTLQAIVDLNPEIDRDALIDNVLELAEQL